MESSRSKGDFEILNKLGEGSFAHVYRARERSTGRTVALKVLKDSFRGNSEVVERFRREAFAVASIDSPHVVRLYDFGLSGEDVFLSMEFAEGLTLRDVLLDHPWTAEDTFVIVGQLAHALAAAHRNDIVHRDLKPENVVLTAGPNRTRHVKVLDFGFAKLAELEKQLGLEPLTRAGLCFGTPHYMAPEQAMGQPVGPSADLFALAVMTYEMVSGTLPWDGDDPRQVLLAVATAPPRPIAKMDCSIVRVEALNLFLQRALAKQKERRPPDAETFFREFQLALFGDQPLPEAAGATESDQAFSSLRGRTISFPEVDFDVDTLVEPLARDASMPEHNPSELERHPTKKKPRRLRSEWIDSLGETSTFVEPLKPEDLARPTGDAKAASPRSTNDEPRALPASPPHARPPWAIILVTILLAALTSAAIGYYLGRHR